MDFWKILGITETKDTVVIKKAYAERVKECHPAEHPREFQVLQEAYRAVLNYAAGQPEPAKTEPAMERDEPREKPSGEEKEAFPYDFSEVNEAAQEPEKESYALYDQDLLKENHDLLKEIRAGSMPDLGRYDEDDLRFLSQVKALLYHPNLRNNMKCWNYFLGQRDNKKYLSKLKNRSGVLMILCQKNFLVLLEREVLDFFRELVKPFAVEYKNRRGEEILYPELNEKQIKSINKKLRTRKLLERLQSRGIGTGENLSKTSELESYLNLYFDYLNSDKDMFMYMDIQKEMWRAQTWLLPPDTSMSMDTQREKRKLPEWVLGLGAITGVLFLGIKFVAKAVSFASKNVPSGFWVLFVVLCLIRVWREWKKRDWED